LRKEGVVHAETKVSHGTFQFLIAGQYATRCVVQVKKEIAYHFFLFELTAEQDKRRIDQLAAWM
jgi:hypothetical protein